MASAERTRVRTVLGRVATVLAALLVWAALLMPDDLSRLRPGALLSIPVEVLLLVLLAAALPAGARRYLAIPVGVLLGLLVIVKVLDMGFRSALDRPFNPVTDWGSFGPAVGVLADSVGRAGAIGAVLGVVLLVSGLLVLVTLSIRRLVGFAAGHRTGSIRAVAALGVLWILCAVFGVRVAADTPVASAGTAVLGYGEGRDVVVGIRDQQRFARAIAADPFGGVAGGDLLTGLRGKDVIVAFVESYGRVAVQGSSFSPEVDTVLDAGTDRLRAAGFSARSAFLTSPTFGGVSWLAHSTLQSGLWIDDQQRYNALVASDRFTLSDAFHRAGWRTVGDVPSNHQAWPEGTSFYHYDTVYDAGNVGYHGPSFSFAAMPDQYILSAFQRLELARPDHRPVMAEIDLVSSHTPWAPLPQPVDWSQVGDGSIFAGMPARGESPDVLWRDANHVRAAYGQSVRYSLNTLVSFVETFHDNNLVLVVLGDHQPASIVSGTHASHDVPISIISADPAVLDRISSWGWQDGLRPGPQAPVWRMDSFRDRFLTAYGSQPPLARH